MASYRAQRTNEDVYRELSALLREMKDPRIQEAMLTVVKVDLAHDCSSCKVFVSSLLGEEKCKEAVLVLKTAAGFLRKELGARIKMRVTPELFFIQDSSIEHSAKIAKILKELDDAN